MASAPDYGATDDSRPRAEHEELLPGKRARKRGPAIPIPVAVGMANLAGVLGIMQTGINTSLRESFFPNPVAACGVSFLCGLLTMILICFVDSAKLPHASSLKECSWYLFVGGVLGGTYKTSAIILAPRIGFATFHIAAVAGQLIAGIICDLVGFQMKPTYPSPFKVLCAGVVLLGTAMSADKGLENKTLDSPATVCVIVACLAGSVLPIQALINFKLGKTIGTTYHAVTLNFFVGTIAMWTVVVIEACIAPTGRKPVFQRQYLGYDDEWWVWSGGSMGAILVVCVTLSLPTLGAATFSLVFISTQLASALVADTLGAFGFARIPLNASSFNRILGVTIATLAAAVCNMKLPPRCNMLNEWSKCESRNKEPMPVPMSPIITRGIVGSDHYDDGEEELPPSRLRSMSDAKL